MNENPMWMVIYGSVEPMTGGDEWSYSEGFADEASARNRFEEVIREQPGEGAYPMDYATLEAPDGSTVATWDAEEAP